MFYNVQVPFSLKNNRFLLKVLKMMTSEKRDREERGRTDIARHAKWPEMGGLGSGAYLGGGREDSALGSSAPCVSECC